MPIPNITITVRHRADCPQKDKGSYYRRCDCTKHLEWNIQGRRFRETTHEVEWGKAEDAKRRLEEKFKEGDIPELKPPTLLTVTEEFVAFKRGKGVGRSILGKYRRELFDLTQFCEKRGKFFANDLRLPDLVDYRETWPKKYPSSQTRQKVQDRLRSFFKYAQIAGHIRENPAFGLDPIRVTDPPVIPLTDEQYAALLAAVDNLFGHEPSKARRIELLIQLMRASALAIQDAICLPRTDLMEINGVPHIVTERRKTGTDVCVPIDPALARELRDLPNSNVAYFFWSGNDAEGTAKNWQGREFRKLFDAIGMPTGHSHQLRHTAAVSWLAEGIPLDQVSKLLGHDSYKTTEKSYARWVPARQQLLTRSVMATWKKKPKLRRRQTSEAPVAQTIQ